MNDALTPQLSARGLGELLSCCIPAGGEDRGELALRAHARGVCERVRVCVGVRVRVRECVCMCMRVRACSCVCDRLR